MFVGLSRLYERGRRNINLRVVGIWVFGLLSSAIMGMLIGDVLDGPQPPLRFSSGGVTNKNDGEIWGSYAGLFLFTCLRLWAVDGRRTPDGD